MPHKVLYTYLDQLSTTANIVDDKPSQLLAVFPAIGEPFGTATSVNPHPEFKRLEAGTITELNVRVTDEYQRQIENHGLPMSVTLEIQ